MRHVPQKRPLSNRRTGVMRSPSRNISRATTSNEPGTLPPTSDQWPFDWLKAMILPSAKIGRIRPHVGEVRAAGIGIVDRIDVTWMHVAVEGAHHVLAGEVQRADMDGDVLIALRGGIALRVVQRVGEVAIVDHEGIAGPEDLLAHLVDAGDEGILQDLESDGIERGFLGHRIHSFTRMMMLRY